MKNGAPTAEAFCSSKFKVISVLHIVFGSNLNDQGNNPKYVGKKKGLDNEDWVPRANRQTTASVKCNNHPVKAPQKDTNCFISISRNGASMLE